MLDEQPTLTDAGREFAERNAAASMVAAVACGGYESAWPAAHVAAATRLMNEAAAAQLEEAGETC